ncbi:MAG: hypothetical protein WBD71_04610, partial [Xanthobacteraceae bacterium]
MLRITVLRVRVFFAVLGCAILGASLVDWAQALHASESGYAWVRTQSSSAPAVETAEIWRTAASCMRPFFIDAALRSKARLKTYYDAVPAEVQAWRTRPSFSGGGSSTAQRNESYRLISDRQNPGQTAAQLERGAMLHARYAEWYANVFKLEIEEHRWEERLKTIADQSVTVNEATRKSFSAGRGTARAAPTGDFDHNLLTLLGLDGFSRDQEQVLLARCVSIVPVKKIFQSANYAGELWRWPVDGAAAFSFGAELLLIAIFFVPIDLWLATGNMRAARRHLAATATRLAVRIHRHGRRYGFRFLNALFGILGVVARATHAIFTARIGSGAAVGQIHFVAKLAQIRMPRIRPLQMRPPQILMQQILSSQAVARIADNGMLGKTVVWLK